MDYGARHHHGEEDIYTGAVADDINEELDEEIDEEIDDD